MSGKQEHGPETMAYLVYAPIGDEHDYYVFADRDQAESYRDRIDDGDVFWEPAELWVTA